jgi:membrane-associated phospholipid phosphatase
VPSRHGRGGSRLDFGQLGEYSLALIAWYRRAVPYVLAAYFVAVVVLFLYQNMRFNVEWVALVLFGAAILSGRGLLFVRDWGVLFVVLMAWQVTSGLATQFDFPEHVTDLITADKMLFFGHVPSVWLQAHLYHPGALEPWDVFAASMYMLHFLAPLVAGFLIWMTDRTLFRRFAIAFVLVAVAGFLTYIVYPADPPWRAALPLVEIHGRYFEFQKGLIDVGGRWIPLPAGTHPHIYLPGVRNLFNTVIGRWYNPYHGTIFLPFLQLHYDQIGAIPSEHAMYPMLFFLFLRRQFGRWGYIALLYICCLVFSILYLGQHYFIDAVVGFAYGAAGYALVMHVEPWLRSLPARKKVSTFTSRGRIADLADLEEA